MTETFHYTALIDFSLDTENAEKNFNLARWYEKQGHTAPAHTYYLRAAERCGNDNISYKILAYSSLIHAASCYRSQGSRDGTEKVLLENALALLPERPEAYYFLTLLYERRRDWQNCYIYAGLGLEKYNQNLIEIEWERPIYFPGKYGLIFQRALSAWAWGKSDESRELFLDLKLNHNLDERHRAIVEKNIRDLKIKLPTISTESDEVTVIIQGAFKEYTNDVVKSYLQVPFVKKIIVSCWEDDDARPEDSLTNLEKVEFLWNKKPSSPGTDNRNLQIVGSLNGLRRSETQTSVKVRSDQIYSLNSLFIMDEYYRRNKGDHKLFVSGLYPTLLFHPRDHIIWGETSDLIKLYDIPLEIGGLSEKIKVDKVNLHKYYSFFMRTETYLGAHYLANFFEEINFMLLQPDKFLFDNSPNWNKAHELSDSLTRQYFKSFPRTNMEMYWVGKNMNYPYEEEKRLANQCWSEDGY